MSLSLFCLSLSVSLCLCVSRLIPPLNQLDLLRNLKNKSGLSFRSELFKATNHIEVHRALCITTTTTTIITTTKQ